MTHASKKPQGVEDIMDFCGSRTRRGRVKVPMFSRGLACLAGVTFVVLARFGGDDLSHEDTQLRFAAGEDAVQTTALSVAHAGSSIATTDSRGRVALWDGEYGWKMDRFLDYQGFASSMAFSPDGQFLAIGGIDSPVALWKLGADGGKQTEVLSPLGVKALAYSPDGRRLAAAMKLSPEILVWNMAERKEPTILRGRSRFVSLAFSPDGRGLAAGEAGERPAVVLWDLEKESRRRVLDGSWGSIWSLAFSQDGSLLATSAAFERGSRIWDLVRGRLRCTTAGHHLGTNAVAFAPDQSTLASVGDDGKVRFWSVENGDQRAVLDGRAAALNQVALSGDGRALVATGTNDNDIRYWMLSDLRRSTRARCDLAR
jgi:WD40 repeat protein